jgi:hypothetical protein
VDWNTLSNAVIALFTMIGVAFMAVEYNRRRTKGMIEAVVAQAIATTIKEERLWQLSYFVSKSECAALHGGNHERLTRLEVDGYHPGDVPVHKAHKPA